MRTSLKYLVEDFGKNCCDKPTTSKGYSNISDIMESLERTPECWFQTFSLRRRVNMDFLVILVVIVG